MLVSLSEKLLQVHIGGSLVFAMSEVTLVKLFRNVDVGILEDFTAFKVAFVGDENLCFKRASTLQVGVVSRTARILISCQQ